MKSKAVKVSELICLLKKGITPKYADSPTDNTFPVINQKCVRNFVIDFSLCRLHDLSKRKIAEDKVLHKFDVLINSTGTGTLGRVAQYWGENQTITVDSHVAILRPDVEVIDPMYFGYLIKSKQQIIETLFTGSTGQTELDKDAVNDLECVVVEDKETQQFIGSLFKSVDDKIANTTAMNQTLEKIAQRIFKSWFIDFDPVKANKEGVAFDGLSPEIQALFPSEFEESELGMIPKGWIPSTIGEEFDLVMGQSPKGTSYNEDADGTVFFQGRRDFNFRFPSVRVYTTEPKKIAKQGDTLLSVRAPVGDVNIALEECCVGRGLAALRHKSNCSSLTYYTVANLKRIFDSFDTEGTVFGSINQKDLKSLKVIKMSEDVANAFSKVISPLDERIKQNTQNTICLERLRDRLLPKLISGQITVGEAQKELAEAI
ncbi:restriction endonuclease subunit S [Photobacterium damselae subsp. damselae]|uniref:restriction endonuclease subunit S n=1 Tax=Photobacterium damselae TaxID=38293 RepID=UPI0015947C28|nr:restriction endonuclease subunit S [Photobacterium damselae]NVH52243.1 restriction endonuclease subunit S [Photobacterium damselae subsp. damselae]NVO82549.1 restriction endonuclease subunit S [Photobacterium damselae subsp. damselae]